MPEPIDPDLPERVLHLDGSVEENDQEWTVNHFVRRRCAQ
jgi:hypothetical protein